MNKAFVTTTRRVFLSTARKPIPVEPIRPVVAMPSVRGTYTYEWPRAALTVDAVLISEPSETNGPPQVLLIQRKQDPYAGSFALPGGFVDEYESLDKAAARELQEETSVDPSNIFMTQVGTFGDKGRDPRGWTVGTAYAAIVPNTDLNVKAADDAADAGWYPIDDLPELAFDHKLIMKKTYEHLAKEEHVLKISGFKELLLDAASKLKEPWINPNNRGNATY